MAGPRPLVPSDVRYIVFHCTGTPANVDLTVAELDRQHRAQGLLRIGYHFVITRDGFVHDGRPLNQRGQHAEGFNHCSVGICLVGGGAATKLPRPEANFTPAQVAAARNLAKLLQQAFRGAKVSLSQAMPDGAPGLRSTPLEL